MTESFEKGQWVVTSNGPIKEIDGKSIYKLSRVGERGETYGCVDKSINKVRPLCRLASPEHCMQPAVGGELGSLVAFQPPYPMVNCVVGRQFEGIKFFGSSFHEYWWDRSYNCGLVCVRTNLMGFFLCRVPRCSRVIIMTGEEKSSDFLMLNLVFRVTDVLSGDAQFSPHSLETAPYTIASGGRDEVGRMLRTYRLVIHGRRAIIVSPSANSSYPKQREAEISPFKGGLIHDMRAFIELDCSACRFPVNISPNLQYESTSSETMPVCPAWSR